MAQVSYWRFSIFYLLFYRTFKEKSTVVKYILPSFPEGGGEYHGAKSFAEVN